MSGSEILTPNHTKIIDAARAAAGKAPAARAPRGPRLPEHLPVREIILNPDAVQACPEELDAHW